MMAALRARGELPERKPEPVMSAEEMAELPAAELPDTRLSRRDWKGARAAIFAATEVDVAEPPTPDVESLARYDAPSAPHEPRSVPERSTQAAQDPTPAYVRQERSWRERLVLPRVKKHLSPSDTTKGRRERYIRDKAARLGISYAEAERLTIHKPLLTRAGRLKEAKAELAEALQEASTVAA